MEEDSNTVVDAKIEKLTQLDLIISHMQEEGIEYNGNYFKCDDEAKFNTMQMDMVAEQFLPFSWFTRNGENGCIVIYTLDEWKAFKLALVKKFWEMQQLYYAKRYMIEIATTVEEVNAVSFGDYEKYLTEE